MPKGARILLRLHASDCAIILIGAALFFSGELGAQSAVRTGQPRDAQTSPSQTKAAPAKKPPQAKTQVEYDAYQKIVAATDPKEKMQWVDQFVANFSSSELRGVAYQQGLQGAQMANDFEKAVDYSRKVLLFYPDDVLSLLLLSSWIPERVTENDPQREAKLTEATNAAKTLLQVVPTLQKPGGETDEQWAAQVKELSGRPHAALGFIKLLLKDYAAAQEEFEKAVGFMPAEPTFFYRLGLAYTYEKKYDAAAWNLARSVALKGVSEKPAKDALGSLFKAYGEDPAKAGEEDLIKMAGGQEKMPPDFSFTKFMEAHLTPPKSGDHTQEPL